MFEEYDYTKTKSYIKDLSSVLPEEAQNCDECCECIRCGGWYECLRHHFIFDGDEASNKKRC